MKNLILIRHAKSDWSNIGQKDYDRELNERGLRDAPMMGKRLAQRDLNIDLVIASTAQRAAQTASLIATEINYPLDKIQWEDKLYHAQPPIIQDTILETDDTYQTIIVVCHNNGITDFANSLAGVITDNMPTCAIMAFNIDANSWHDFVNAKKTLLFYDYPKL